MDNSNLIKEFDQIFVQFLRSGQKVIDYNMKRLTAPGENYGSVMVAIEITIEDGNKIKETLNTVAKIVPKNEFLQKFFHTPITFGKEVGFYSVILPDLKNFCKEFGLSDVLEFFPKLYGLRLSLDSKSQVIDSNAVLMLENLKVKNYQVLDRTIGFDLAETKLLLKNLAELHATSIAFKLAKPDEFQQKFLPYAERFPVFDSLQLKTTKILREQIYKIAEDSEISKLHLYKLKEAMEIQDANMRKLIIEIREPFATLIHNDYWVTNTMILYENNTPIKNKMVDFQVLEYGSPARDLIFFLFSSVKIPVLQNNYDNFINLYYQTFISILKKFKCDVKQFPLQLLLKEIDYEAKNVEFFHNIIMLGPIHAEKNTVKEVVEIDEEDLMLNYKPTESRKEKLLFFIEEFAKRNWI